MPLLILLAFIALPLLEIGVFIRVGSEIGLVPTLATTLLTAVIGTLLMRAQGIATLKKVRDSLDHGDMPVRAVFDGACKLVAGALLLAPGFITDGIGLLLFVPLIRSVFLALLISRASISMAVPRNGHNGPAPRRGYDVDGDYQDITPANTPALSDESDDSAKKKP